ncbi:hypothetical protein SDC9_138474 [bioreactor metagenome]|uniref:Uncharacterized protein n=1 Tax=bioreactor metagenome TaxID=1076179 RepID=A0A645DPX3_9ZZZZ
MIHADAVAPRLLNEMVQQTAGTATQIEQRIGRIQREQFCQHVDLFAIHHVEQRETIAVHLFAEIEVRLTTHKAADSRLKLRSRVIFCCVRFCLLHTNLSFRSRL